MRKIIYCDGTERELPEAVTLRELASLIGASTLDTVNLRHLGQPLHVMCVDDDGYEVEPVQHSPTHLELRPVRARKPVNHKATLLYLKNCSPGTTHEIVGDVVIVPDADFA